MGDNLGRNGSSFSSPDYTLKVNLPYIELQLSSELGSPPSFLGTALGMHGGDMNPNRRSMANLRFMWDWKKELEGLQQGL